MTVTGGSDGVTIERHGDVAIFAFAPPLDNIDAGLVEDITELLMGCLRSSVASG